MNPEQSSKREQEPNLLDALKVAINSGDIAAARESMDKLDAYLVGEGRLLQLDKQPDFDSFVLGYRNGCKIYLGDYGTSRLMMHREGGDIRFEISKYNSTPNVIQHWEELMGE